MTVKQQREHFDFYFNNQLVYFSRITNLDCLFHESRFMEGVASCAYYLGVIDDSKYHACLSAVSDLYGELSAVLTAEF